MPSTATTNVTIGTILDLLGPTVSTTAQAKDQGAFDALLQPPPSPPPPARDERPISSARQQTNEAAPQQSSSQAASPSADESSSTGSDSLPEPTEENATVAGEDSEAVGDTWESQEAEQPIDELVVESLAAIAVIAPALIINAPIDAAKSADEVAGQEPIETTATTGKQKRGRSQASVGSSPESKAAADTTALVVQPTDAIAETERRPSTTTNHPKAEGFSDPAGKPHASAEETALLESAKGELAEAEIPIALSATDASRNAGNPTHDQQRDGAKEADAQQLKLEASAGSSSPADRPAAEASKSVGVVTAPITQSPAIQATQGSASSSNNTAINAAAPSTRSRLPAEVLSQRASGPNRPAAVEIDSARLLSRVARAFAAAQERDGEIHLRLSPPELGSLRLDVRVQDGALVARLQTETDAARTAILDNLPALRERLNEQGVRIERFNVDLMQRQPGGTPDQTGGRQQEPTPAGLRVAPPARPRAESAATTANISASAATASGGLNVII